MVTLQTILDDIACGVTEVEVYTDLEVLKSRVELGDQGARFVVGVDGPGLARNDPYPRHG